MNGKPRMHTENVLEFSIGNDRFLLKLAIFPDGPGNIPDEQYDAIIAGFAQVTSAAKEVLRASRAADVGREG